MSSSLCLTIRFLDPVPQFHGRGDGGDPEWPPSPLRMFQAMVCASATRWRENQFPEYARPALQWLEAIPPAIVAPQVPAKSFGYRMYVPNNSGDLMTAAWARGDTETSMAKFRVEKDVRPTNVHGDALHYLFPLPDGTCPHFDVLQAATRSITHLGWGVDMVAGSARVITEEEAAKLEGHHWQPVAAGGTPLRLPRAGTLSALMEKHTAFLGRLSGDAFKPVPPLPASGFAVKGYASATAGTGTPAAARPFAAFELHKTIAEQAELAAGKSRFRPFDAVRRFATVAGMVRHAAKLVAKSSGWTDKRIGSFILGHGDDKDGQATTDDRLMFLPLPSITPLKVESIRRVLVVGPPGSEQEVSRLRQLLNGQELLDEKSGRPCAMLSFIPPTDRNVMRFTGESRMWSTVTPVMLPGYDDPDGLRNKLRGRVGADEQKKLLARLDRRILELIEKAFVQAGYPEDLLRTTEIEYRGVGFRAGVDLAHRYELPPLGYPRFHVRVRFVQPIKGPLVLGAGRYRGLGLLAPCDT